MATSSRRIRANNPNLSNSEKTQLDGDYTTGQTTLTVISNFGFQDNDIVVVGEPSTEKAEASDVTSTTGNATVNISATLKFGHSAGTPVYRSEYDKIEFSFHTSGGSWTVLDTVGIKWDDTGTVYIHQGGIDGNSYRYRFYNSASSNFSEYSPTSLGSGHPKSSVGYLVRDIRKIVKDPDRKIVSDEDVIRYLVEAKDIVKGSKSDWYFWLKEDLGTITTTAGTRKYNLDTIATTIEYVRDVRFRDVSGSDDILYHLTRLSDPEFDEIVRDQNESDDDSVAHYRILPPDSNSTSGYIEVDPTPLTTSNGSFYIRFYQPDTDYTGVDSTTAIPIPQILRDYAVAKIEEIKGNDEKASIYSSRFYGPQGRNLKVNQLTGIALLLRFQVEKGKPIGQPRQLKNYLGRKAVKRLYGSRSSAGRDYKAEHYW